MPLTTLTMRTGRSTEEKKALMDGVHAALMQAFAIPETDRNQYINEIAPDNWDMPGSPDRIIVEINAFAGRSVDAKRALYASIVEKLGQCGVTPGDVFIIVNDLPLENWGLRGGQAGCDIDFGFKIDV